MERLVKMQILIQSGLGWGLRDYSSNVCPDAADVANSRPTLSLQDTHRD